MPNRQTSRQAWKTLALSILASSALIAGSLALTVHGNGTAEPQAAFVAPGQQGGFADLIERVQPSVATVEVSKLSRTGFSNPGSGDPRAQEFFERFFGHRGVPQEAPRQSRGVGSAFVVDADGYLVTNDHVIDGAEKVTVVLSNGKRHDAEVIGSDPKTDLALLKIDARDLTVSKLGDSDRTRVGDWVIAIGNPFGLGGTATVGIVSARGRDLQSGPYDDYLQIDAPINQGNSGGPVFNTSGEVVGVNTAIYSPNGGNVGIAFAIPANQIINVVQELRSHGSVDRGWLGVQIQDLNDALAESLELDSPLGALVADVVKDSPAAQAGIVVGDVIVAIDSDQVDNARMVSQWVGASDSGDRVTVTVVRNGKIRHLKVKLGDAERQQLASSGAAEPHSMLGLSLAPLTDEQRRRSGEDVDGLVVAGVDPDSAAAQLGVRPGDLVVQANGTPVHSVREFEKMLDVLRKRGSSKIRVLLKRGESQQFVALPIA